MSRTIEYGHVVCANCHGTLSALKPFAMDELPKCSKCSKNWWIEQPLRWESEQKSFGKHITFSLHSLSATGKTKTWFVWNTENNDVLGRISWFGRWRKYVFTAQENIVFEETCLRDISQFIQQETTYVKKAAARRAARTKAAKA